MISPATVTTKSTARLISKIRLLLLLPPWFPLSMLRQKLLRGLLANWMLIGLLASCLLLLLLHRDHTG
jgi:hypothetical protein